VRKPNHSGCFLCHILQGDDDKQNLLLKRGVTSAVVINRYPYNNGHLMVCPYRHIDDLSSMTPEEKLENMELVSESIGALKHALQPDGFNVGVNLGQVAGAGLQDHVHTHVVPRWDGDTNFMAVFSDVKVIPQALRDLWDQLHPLLNP